MAAGNDLAQIIARLPYRDMSGWQSWMGLFGHTGSTAPQNLIFHDQHTILKAAWPGQGIGMAE